MNIDTDCYSIKLLYWLKRCDFLVNNWKEEDMNNKEYLGPYTGPTHSNAQLKSTYNIFSSAKEVKRGQL